MNNLSDYELDQLLEAQNLDNRSLMYRLINELRELRHQAAERERMANEEIGG